MFRRCLGAAGRLEGVWGLHGAAWCCKGDAWGRAMGSGGAGEEVREGDSATAVGRRIKGQDACRHSCVLFRNVA